MNYYLAIITTVLVITQIIRLIQNTYSLHQNNKVIKAELDEVGYVTDKDLENKRMVDELLVELLPMLITKYEDESDD